jgi:hypothetical protein
MLALAWWNARKGKGTKPSGGVPGPAV